MLQNKRLRLILIITPLVIAFMSFFLLAKTASSVEFHKANIESLESKKDKVMELTAASAAASAAITLIPGDVATPIASELADLSSKFVIVICAIYLEKYLLTITGYVTFAILIPIACLLFCAGALFYRPSLFRTSTRIALFGLALFFMIPASLRVSGMIENTYHESIESTINSATQTVEEIEAGSKENAAESTADGATGNTAAGENQSAAANTAGSASDESAASENKPGGIAGAIGGLIDSITEGSQKVTESITNSVSQSTESFRRLFNNMLEAFAVMLVTSCVIPVLVLILFVWAIKLIVGSNVGPMPPVPMPPIPRP